MQSARSKSWKDSYHCSWKDAHLILCRPFYCRKEPLNMILACSGDGCLYSVMRKRCRISSVTLTSSWMHLRFGPSTIIHETTSMLMITAKCLLSHEKMIVQATV